MNMLLTCELVYDEIEIERVSLVEVDDLVRSERGSRGGCRRYRRQARP